MRQRICAMALSIALLLGILAVPASAGNLSNFQKTQTYTNQFADVPAGAWYAQTVKSAFELGLIGGKSATKFDPTGNLTLAEAAKLAASLHSIYATGKADFPAATPWYTPYVQYLQAQNLLTISVSDWTAKATRAQFAALLAASLPESALSPINDLADKAIPDVGATATYYDAVYLLYRAGVLTGSDSRGSFKPNSYIQRSEVATIVTRMADATQRKPLQLDTALSAQALFAQCAPAVAYVEVFDAAGKLLGTGSGFFITEGGKFVTNCHVIEGAVSATVKTTDGVVHKVTGAYGADPLLDLALLQVEGSGYACLTQGDSKNLATGQNVFAIGSPLGLENSLSTGIISSQNRQVYGRSYIQVTAAISPGSSGGALLDEQGRVIGVTTASLTDGQSINLAVPIHLLSQMKTSASPQPLSAMVTAAAVTMTLSAPNPLSLTVGTAYALHYAITDPTQAATECDVTIGNPALLHYEYGEWTDADLPLTLTGRSAGTTTVTMKLYDEQGSVLATHTLTVTISGAAAATTAFYADWSPAVDFGAFSGAPVYHVNADRQGALYLYRITDLRISTEQAVSGYFDQLIQQGFEHTHSFIDSAGQDVAVFEQAAKGIVLMYGIAYLNNTPCISIFLTAR